VEDVRFQNYSSVTMNFDSLSLEEFIAIGRNYNGKIFLSYISSSITCTPIQQYVAV